MKTEYEAKFLRVDPLEIRSKLTALGAKCVHEKQLMKRVLFDHPTMKKAFIRIRDEGEVVTMTGKHIVDDTTVGGMREIEFVVDDFNNAKAFINFLGIPTRSYQESYREKWHLGDIDFTIDERPGIPPFLEVEGSTKDIVEEICPQLGLQLQDAYFGAVDVIYEETLGISKQSFNELQMVTFDDPPKGSR